MTRVGLNLAVETIPNKKKTNKRNVSKQIIFSFRISYTRSEAANYPYVCTAVLKTPSCFEDKKKRRPPIYMSGGMHLFLSVSK